MRFFSLTLSLLLLIPAVANADVINGDFETGNFNGWTITPTANGQTNISAVTNFDIDGPGPLGSSFAALFEVGQVNFDPGVLEGIDLTQSINLVAGIEYTFDFDWAATRDSGGSNTEGGVFSLIVNGNVLASAAAGATDPTNPHYGHITAMFTPGSTGSFEVGVNIARPFTIPSGGLRQHVDNFTVTGIPEPSSAALLGVCLIGGWMSRRRK